MQTDLPAVGYGRWRIFSGMMMAQLHGEKKLRGEGRRGNRLLRAYFSFSLLFIYHCKLPNSNLFRRASVSIPSIRFPILTMGKQIFCPQYRKHLKLLRTPSHGPPREHQLWALPGTRFLDPSPLDTASLSAPLLYFKWILPPDTTSPLLQTAFSWCGTNTRKLCWRSL